MKRIAGFMAATLMVAGIFAGCASSKNNAAATAGAAQAEAEGRPRWAQRTAVTFTSEEAPGYFNNGHEAYRPVTDGLFAAGYATRADQRSAEIAARSQARNALASYVSTTLSGYTAVNSVSAEEVNITTVNTLLSGSRVVDSFYEDSGSERTMYLLMFISQKDLEKSASGSPAMQKLLESLAKDKFETLSAEEAEAVRGSN